MPDPAPVTIATLMVFSSKRVRNITQKERQSPFLSSGVLLQEIEQHLVETLGLLQVREVPAVFEHRELRSGDAPCDALGELRRIHAVLVAGDDERRHSELLERRGAVLRHRCLERLAVGVVAQGVEAGEERGMGARTGAAAEQARRRFGAALLALLDELQHLLGAERIEARAGVGERQRAQALRVRQGKIARDASPHREPRKMHPGLAEEVDRAMHVGGEILEPQRALVVVRVAVAARVPCGGPEPVLREKGELVLPMVAVAADPVEEEHERPASRGGHCDARGARNQRGPGRHSALAPEIFTARPRLSLSLRMYSAKASGLLPTTS